MPQCSIAQRCMVGSGGLLTTAQLSDASISCYSSSAQFTQLEASSTKDGSAPHEDCPSSLPTLPGDVVDKILDLVKQSWRDRQRMLAKDEVREWTQYSLVSKAWQAAFEEIPLCIEFREAPSKQQVAWLRSTRTPIRRVTFLPSCTPCKSTASAYISHAQDLIRLCPGKIEPPPVPSRRLGAVA